MDKEHARRIVDFQEIRSVPLTAVLARLGLVDELKRVGSSLVGCCPICGAASRKCFTVSINRTPQLWKCFSLEHQHESGGDVLTFVSQYENVTIKEAGERIASWFAIASSRTATNQHLKRRKRRMAEATKSANRPTHRVYSCEPRGDGEKDKLHEVGAAWPFTAKNGKTGLNIKLSSMPLWPRLALFEADEKPDEPELPEVQPQKPNGRRK